MSSLKQVEPIRFAYPENSIATATVLCEPMLLHAESDKKSIRLAMVDKAHGVIVHPHDPLGGRFYPGLAAAISRAIERT